MHRTSHDGFTLIELLTVIAVIAVLAGILLPVFAQAREGGRRTSCLSNQRQLGLGVRMYAFDYDEFMPIGDSGASASERYTWRALVLPYVRNRQVFRCPSNGHADLLRGVYHTWYPGDGALGIDLSYAGNTWWAQNLTLPLVGHADGVTLTEVEAAPGGAATKIMLAEARIFWPDVAGWSDLLHVWDNDASGHGQFMHHQKFINFAYFDGHSRARRLKDTFDGIFENPVNLERDEWEWFTVPGWVVDLYRANFDNYPKSEYY